MAKSESTTFNIKGSNGYVKLYPLTTKKQIPNLKKGQTFGPYVLELIKTNWNTATKQQIINLNGVLSTDIIYCTKILDGALSSIKTKDKAYSSLSTIESLTNQVRFTCKEIPTETIKVQVEWQR